MGKTIIFNQPLDMNDLTARLDFNIEPFDRLTVSMNDEGSNIVNAVAEFVRGVCGVKFTSLSTPAVFNATNTFLPALDVEDSTRGRIQVTAVEGSEKVAFFTVYGYTVED